MSSAPSGKLDPAQTGPNIIPRLDAAEEPLDLGSASAEDTPPYSIRPYDPMKTRESIRGWIALSLIAMLAVVVVASLALVWIHPDRSKELHELLSLVFGPLIALVGSATGYYFGSQASQPRG